MQNTGEPLFRPTIKSKLVISNCNENQSVWNAFFGHKSELNISRERNHSNANVRWSGLLLHRSPIFRSTLRGFFFLWKRNNEIIKSILLFFPLFWTILYGRYTPIQTLIITLFLRNVMSTVPKRAWVTCGALSCNDCVTLVTVGTSGLFPPCYP